MKSARLSILALVSVTAGCGAIDRTQPAHGEVTSLIVIAADTLWEAVGDTVQTALEPRIFTVRNEKAFEVTHVSPLSEDWIELRRFKQVLLMGRSDDGWIQPVLAKTAAGDAPAIVEGRDIWASGQTVTAIVLPADDGAAAIEALLPVLGERLDERFRQHVRSRMFLSDANTELRDSLESQAGFSLTLPNLYRPDVDGSLYVFRSSNDVGGQLARVISVTWREGLHELTPDDVLAWRDTIAARVFPVTPGQAIAREQVHVRPLVNRPPGSIEVHSVWQSRDRSNPAGGPFVARVIVCPEQNRTYFVEAWLFAPGRRKYEYMVQFETLLDAFECGSAPR